MDANRRTIIKMRQVNSMFEMNVSLSLSNEVMHSKCKRIIARRQVFQGLHTYINYSFMKRDSPIDDVQQLTFFI